MMDVDVLVIGGGPAGTTAAIRAGELGARTLLVEARDLGGTCVITGCVPTRALAKTARLIREVRAAATYGIASSEPSLTWSETVAMVRKVTDEVRARKDDAGRLDEAGVEVIEGERARLLDEQTAELSPSGTQVRFASAIVCVGGHSRRLRIPGAEHTMFAEHILDLQDLPERVVVIGSGATGAQLVTIFNAFGCEVTLLETADRVLPAADHDVSATLERSFRAHGVEVMTDIDSIERVERTAGGMRVIASAGRWHPQITVDMVVSAVGWPANVDDLGLEAAGVTVEHGVVPVDQYLRSSVPSIYVAGDANGPVMLVQTAQAEAEAAATNAVLGPSRAAGRELVPWGGFTDPDVAGVGLTEWQARERDRGCVVATVPYTDLERAIIDNRTEGLCKLIADRHRSLLLGAHAAGESAVEVIQAVTAAMAAGADVATLARVQFAYPTYTAAIGVAARRLMTARPRMA